MSKWHAILVLLTLFLGFGTMEHKLLNVDHLFNSKKLK
jgi:hypothetical protein